MRVLVSEAVWDFDLEAALKEISAQRREQALKYPVFEYNEHGKPSIVGHPEIFFNLSHCKEAAVCVVSDQPVGIDVESIRAYKESLVNYTMNDEEIAQIKSAEDPAAFFIRLWTMKEATTKLIGTGISNDLKSVIDARTYKYTTVERQRYIYTVCENLI